MRTRITADNLRGSALRSAAISVLVALSVAYLAATAQAAQEPAAPTAPPPPPNRPDVTVDDPALTLADCFTLALARSETIAIQQELIKETEGRFLQALSGVLPNASFEASKKWQDGTGGSAFTLGQVPERKLVFSQPLFSGFKEFAAMAGSRAERRERGALKARAEHLLFVDVSDAFFLILERQANLDTLETIRTALLERLEDLRAREQLGRSRPSEVASARAQLRRVEAEQERARSDERTARQLLEFLTGRSPLGPVVDDEPAPPPLEHEEAYVGKASSRPDVRASKEAWALAKNEVVIEQAGFWPDIDVESNYFTRRVGSASGVDWDVLLKMDVPIFQGGNVLGAVREARSKARQAKLVYERTQREAELDIRTSRERLQGGLAQQAALEEALKAAEENYRLQLEDYRLNLVNHLDVLQALQALEEARQEAIAARYETKRRYRQLRVATGDTL